MSYQPSLHTAVSKALGTSGVPTDARTYFFDTTYFKYRPYTSTSEVLSYLVTSLNRTGNFPVVVNTGGTLTNGVITGGTNVEWWFKDGVADGNLVVKSTGGSSITNTDQLPEGTTNLYFEELRVLNTVLSGLDTSTAVSITSTDSLLSALGKLQGQVTGVRSATTYQRSSPATRTVGGVSIGDSLTNLTVDFILEKILAPYTAPTITNTVLNPSLSSYNAINVNYNVTFRWVKNIGTPSFVSAQVQYKKNSDSTWTNLTTSVNTVDANTEDASGSVTTNTSGTDNQNVLFRCSFTDSSQTNFSNTVTSTFSPYVAPSISFSVGTVLRELGDINTNITGTITRNTPNIPLTNYQVQYQVNGSGSWISIGSPTIISGLSASISVNHNDSSLINSTSLNYRVVVNDFQQPTTSSTNTINFVYKSVLGYSTGTTITLTTLLGMSNPSLTNSKVRTILGVTAASTEYTYYCYDAAAGDISALIQNNVEDITPVMDKLSDLSGVNSFGASVTYRIYKSHAPGAFTNSSLAFS